MLDEVKETLVDTLQLGPVGNTLDESSQLLGNLPELDSMAVVTLLTALEDKYGFIVEDDEISADAFETLGSLVAFVQSKIDG